MSNDRYRRWDDADAVERFAAKTAGDFFRTETHFLADAARDLESVLDIGCASGRFVELLAALGVHPAYTGIDISPEQIASARRLYPDADFHLGNALELAITGPFDLVNATGVMQHEPRFAELIARMVDWSRRYVLFDVKLSDLDEDIVDITRSHAGTPEHPLFFNILSARRLIERLRALPGIARFALYGYETPPNASTTIPAEMTRLVSAGVFLELGQGPATVTTELPEGLA
jgi:SAM-dependent methyltransferase